MINDLHIVDIHKEEQYLGVGLGELLELVVHGQGRHAPGCPEVSNDLHNKDTDNVTNYNSDTQTEGRSGRSMPWIYTKRSITVNRSNGVNYPAN